jgi:hypothetical protein
LARSVPTREPTSFTAGDSVAWTSTPVDYPIAEGWSLGYTLVLQDKRYAAVMTNDGATFTAKFNADDLADVTVETEARLVGRVTGSGSYAGEAHVVYDRGVTIAPNPAKSTLTSERSDAAIELDAVKAAILAITNEQLSAYTISGRAATKLDLPALYHRQATLEARLRDESGRGFRRRLVSFVNV